MLKEGIRTLMGASGNVWDNSAMESVFVLTENRPLGRPIVVAQFN
jgi:hypothetical protein